MIDKQDKENILFAYLQPLADWWKGFNEQNQSRLPTVYEKQQMLRYPIINAICQVIAMPLLSPKYSIIGDEKQKLFVERWFKQYYRRIVSLMYEKSVQWGFSVGERIMDIEEIDGASYWMHKSIINPPPHECNLLFSRVKPRITGFQWGNYTVNRFVDDTQTEEIFPGMVYMSFRGEEISRPYGWSTLNDQFWAWQLVMKEWTSWVVYKRMKVPVWVLYFLPELTKDGTASSDIARARAQQHLENLKNSGGITLPKYVVEDRATGEKKWEKGWELLSADMQDREPGYHESIRILNSLMYIVALTPERLFEQWKDTGSQAMVSVQKDFYMENVLTPRMKEQKECVIEGFINPMLRANFGKVDCEVEMTVLDRMAELYVEIIKENLKGTGGMGLIDWKEVYQRAGFPVDPTKIEPVLIDAGRKTQVPGANFETRKDQRDRVKKHVEKWVVDIDKSVQEIKGKAYTRLEKDLRAEQGRIGISLPKLFESGYPKPEDIARAVQIPRRIFGDIWPLALEAWEAGMLPWIDEAKKRVPTPYMAAPSKPIEKELWALTIEMEGFERGSTMIAGEGEQLERRLFAALCFGAQSKEEALRIINDTFNKYIEELLPNRLINLFHTATVLGSKDALQYLNMRDLERKRG